MGDVHVGLQARLMSQALRKLTASLATGPRNSGGSGPGGADVVDEETGEIMREHAPALIFINQLRQKIGGTLHVAAPAATTVCPRLSCYLSLTAAATQSCTATTR